MNTPVWDFVRRYAESGAARFHMPGHKGAGVPEKWDLTEIAGADSLWEASGILLESEKNAARLFGAMSIACCSQEENQTTGGSLARSARYSSLVQNIPNSLPSMMITTSSGPPALPGFPGRPDPMS